jgi:hypothetical protein
VLFVRKDLEDFMEIFYEQQEIFRIEIRENRNILILLDLLSKLDSLTLWIDHFNTS